MTRRDYVLIAAAMLKSKPDDFEYNVIRWPYETQWLFDCDTLANALASDNDAFDKVMFLSACGAIKANDA